MGSEALYDFDRRIRRERGGQAVAGCDEAGRGPLAGPVVAAAVVLDLDTVIDGVMDSKKLSPRRRERLYGEITGRALAWAVERMEPADIDRLNILQASLTAMHRALERIRPHWTTALVDGNQYIRALGRDCQLAIIKGDSLSASVAAASILAKETRDRIMEQYHTQYPRYGFDRHKCYPTAEHMRLVRRYGMSDIHRRSFCANLMIETELDFNANPAPRTQEIDSTWQK